eukprot:TRINITY_DN21515_c0_g2_i1.p2 TRINITY_DN21515_c0_g2~~TRINITY_DN21515_c0_g2_i1.p2  ORF type:complete len:151 (-),score=27.28 TRINITY_DN21515_c0_g2_i1:209-661(-)
MAPVADSSSCLAARMQQPPPAPRLSPLSASFEESVEYFMLPPAAVTMDEGEFEEDVAVLGVIVKEVCMGLEGPARPVHASAVALGGRSDKRGSVEIVRGLQLLTLPDIENEPCDALPSPGADDACPRKRGLSSSVSTTASQSLSDEALVM